MKATAVLSVLLGAVSVAAQLPACAQACVNAATSNSQIGSCPANNASCICTSTALLNQFACCLSRSCSKADQDASVTYAHGICNSHNSAMPSAVVCR
ncbi:CFEM domain-containing protein [Microdochium nivale]|nr:CFEM domain-containing protein [Microdochium nivale]